MTAPPVTVRGVQLNRGEAMTAVLGLAVGAFVGVAFDEHTVRPPAHTDGLWILLVVVVSARHTMIRGILRGAGALLLGVLAAQFSRTWPRPQGTARRSEVSSGRRTGLARSGVTQESSSAQPAAFIVDRPAAGAPGEAGARRIDSMGRGVAASGKCRIRVGFRHSPPLRGRCCSGELLG